MKGTSVKRVLYEETAFNTAPGTPSGTLIDALSDGIVASQSLERDETLRVERGQGEPARGNVDVSGPLKTYISPEQTPVLLKHALGAPTATGAGPYVHTFVPGDLPVSFRWERDYSRGITGNGAFEQLGGERISGFTLNIPQSGWPTIDWDVKGSSQKLDNAALDATPTDLGYSPLRALEGVLKEGGATLAKAVSASIKLDNDLDTERYGIGSGERVDMDEGHCMVDVELDVMFDDPALLVKAEAATATSLTYTLSRGDGGGTAGNESVEVQVENLTYERASVPVEGPKGLNIKLRGQGWFKVSDSSFFKVIVKNQQATI